MYVRERRKELFLGQESSGLILTQHYSVYFIVYTKKYGRVIRERRNKTALRDSHKKNNARLPNTVRRKREAVHARSIASDDTWISQLICKRRFLVSSTFWVTSSSKSYLFRGGPYIPENQSRRFLAIEPEIWPYKELFVRNSPSAVHTSRLCQSADDSFGSQLISAYREESPASEGIGRVVCSRGAPSRDSRVDHVNLVAQRSNRNSTTISYFPDLFLSETISVCVCVRARARNFNLTMKQKKYIILLLLLIVIFYFTLI